MAYPDVILGDDGDKLYVRLMIFKKKGDVLPRHRHPYGHHHVLHTGAALYLIDGQLVRHQAPFMFWVKPDTDHMVVADEDGTQASCIHDRTTYATVHDI